MLQKNRPSLKERNISLASGIADSVAAGGTLFPITAYYTNGHSLETTAIVTAQSDDIQELVQGLDFQGVVVWLVEGSQVAKAAEWGSGVRSC